MSELAKMSEMEIEGLASCSGLKADVQYVERLTEQKLRAGLADLEAQLAESEAGRIAFLGEASALRLKLATDEG